MLKPQSQADPPPPPWAALWPWFVLPALPLLAGLVALQVLAGDGFTFAAAVPKGDASAVAAKGTWPFFEGLMVYAAMAGLHVTLCGFWIIYMGRRIQGFPLATRSRLWLLIAFLLLVLAVLGVFARDYDAALQLTYRNTCELLSTANAAHRLVTVDCHGSEMNRLFWLAATPTVAGLIVAILAAALAASVTAPLPHPSEAAWRTAFTGRIQLLRTVLYMTSAVLVTSTITMNLFLRLPVPTLDKLAAPAAASHASGMTVFWGTVMTLTLIVVFAPAVYALMEAAHRHATAAGDAPETSAWVEEQLRASVPQKLGSLVAILAPLLVGPVGGLLETLVNAR